MWQNLLSNLSRNPAALKALAELVAPTLRNLVRQQTADDLAQLRQRVEALGAVVGGELPAALAALRAGQQESRQEIAALRQQLAQALADQREREAAWRAELAALRRELQVAQEAARRAQAAGNGLSGRRRWPWQGDDK